MKVIWRHCSAAEDVPEMVEAYFRLHAKKDKACARMLKRFFP